MIKRFMRFAFFSSTPILPFAWDSVISVRIKLITIFSDCPSALRRLFWIVRLLLPTMVFISQWTFVLTTTKSGVWWELLFINLTSERKLSANSLASVISYSSGDGITSVGVMTSYRDMRGIISRVCVWRLYGEWEISWVIISVTDL